MEFKPMFIVTKRFINGNLEGITIDDESPVSFEVGKEYGVPSTRYVVEDCKPKMKKVRNLMSGREIEIAADTPLCCDPSSETYWSM